MTQPTNRPPELIFHPCTSARWPDLEELFGERGACGGCWCMFWLLPRREFDAGKGSGNKRALKKLVSAGREPGILAYIGKEPVGWCAVAPREDYVALERSRILKPVDEQAVWSISCLFIKKPYRRKGVSTQLLKAAVEFAAKRGAKIVEGYPVEPSMENMPAPFLWHGIPSAFKAAGFEEVLRRSKSRPIMRFDIKGLGAIVQTQPKRGQRASGANHSKWGSPLIFIEARPKKPSDTATAIKHAHLKLFLRLSLLLLVCASLVPTAGFQQAPGSDSGLLEMGRAAKPAQAANAPAELKVVSYNIRWRGGEELRELIKLFREDSELGASAILGLQEVDRDKKRTGNVNTVKLLAEELGKHYAWAAPPTPKANMEEETGVAILSSYPLADVNRIVLPHPGPGGRKRVAIGATITVAGAPLRVYSVHSENRISVDKKIGQTKAVLEDLARYPKDMRAIILGDLNTWEPSAVKKTSALFAGENFTTPFANDKSTFLRMILIVPIRFKLDWIWLRGLDAIGHGIDKKVGLSDHWPLWTIVSLKRRR